MIYKFLLFFLLIALPVAVVQAEGKAVSQQDTATLTLLPSGALDKYHNDADFDYGDRADLEEKSLWDIIKLYILSLLGRAATHVFSGGWISYVVLAVAVVVLAVLLSKLLGINLNVFYKGGKKSAAIAYSVEEDNIHEIDFNSQIEQAMNEGNFRRVVRLIYLHMLKELSERDMIRWKANKTNADYLLEMRRNPLADQFETLNYYFVYSWYGDFDVNLAQVEKVRSVFDKMKNQLPSS